MSKCEIFLLLLSLNDIKHVYKTLLRSGTRYKSGHPSILRVHPLNTRELHINIDL